MFKKNPDTMRMEATPERVFSVCRMIAQKNMTKDELKENMSLGSSNADRSEITASITVATEELNIVTVKDGVLSLSAPFEILETPSSFRRYVSSYVFPQQDTTFVIFSKWYIGKNEEVFKLKNWEDKAINAKKEVTELSALNENATLGWRFWAAFLGLGYLSGTTLIPNIKTRLQDLLILNFSKNFQYEESLRANEFTNWLQGYITEAIISHELPLAVSAGFRTLHELGLVNLETQKDAEKVFMYKVKGEPINEFSHITVRKEICI